jgi:hypothetical protein
VASSYRAASSRGKKNRATVAEALRTHYRAPTGTVTGNNKSWLKSHRLDSFEEQIGAPLELDDRPANQFVGGFLRSPAMNFILARCAAMAVCVSNSPMALQYASPACR